MKKIISFCIIIMLFFCLNITTADAEDNNIILSKPVVNNGITIWDSIYFGNYWQYDTNSDGIANTSDSKSKIKWRVLSVNGNDAFIMADRCIENSRVLQDYDVSNKDTVFKTWENSKNRNWLNSKFISDAFTSDESSAIIPVENINEASVAELFSQPSSGGAITVDKVFVLAQKDLINTEYGFDGSYDSMSPSRVAISTPYSRHYSYDSSCEFESNIGESMYITRTPYMSNKYVQYVFGNGSVDIYHAYCSELNKNMGIRPVLHLDISNKNIWEYAGKVKSTDYKDVKLGKVKKIKTKKDNSINVKSKIFQSNKVGKGRKVIRVSFGAVDNAESYQLTCCVKGSKKGVKKFEDSATRFLLTGLKKNIKYEIKIRAVCGKKNGKFQYKSKWTKVTVKL